MIFLTFTWWMSLATRVVFEIPYKKLWKYGREYLPDYLRSAAGPELLHQCFRGLSCLFADESPPEQSVRKNHCFNFIK